MSRSEIAKPSQNFTEKDDNLVQYGEFSRRIINSVLLHSNSVLKKCLFASILLNICLGSAVVYESQKSLMVPYVVQTDSNGYAVAVGLATQTNYDPKEKEIQRYLEDFIMNSRTLPLDPVVAKQMRLKAAALTTQATRSKLNQDLRKESMTERLGLEMSQIQIISNVLQANNTYQVRWTEEVYNREGTLKEKYNMVGSFTYEIGKSKNENDWRLNPLSIYITNYSWARELR